MRRKGLSERVLEEVMDELAAAGWDTEKIYIADEEIRGCRACLHCERTGECVLGGDRTDEILTRLIPSSDVVVVAAPVYFTGVPWKLKALVDRIQLLWARRVRLGMEKAERGASAVILVGGTSPEKYFSGPMLVLRSALKELGYPAKWSGALAEAESGRADSEGFMRKARREVRTAAEAVGRKGG